MTSVEAFLGLLLAAILIALVAKRLDQPYPIALVLGGIGLALIPGVPRVSMDPDMVFFLLLPPVLTEAAFFTSWRDFLRYKRPILTLAFGLVAATSVTVAFLCVYFIPGMSWGAGLLLGAIVSPPDAAAATSITRGMGLPRRVTQILEGESLVNDAAGLTLYRFAVIFVAGGLFSWESASLSFLWIILGGSGLGCLLGLCFVRLYRFLRDPEVEVLATFLLSYLSYFVAETVHASGVLATVASGLILGWYAPELFGANTRIRSMAVWKSVIFLVNSTIFLLIGLQIPAVVSGLQDYPMGLLLWWSFVVLAGVIVLRLLWVFPFAYLPRVFSKQIRDSEPKPDWRAILVIGWTGLRGVVSLAGALALPNETMRGLPFPYRNLIVFLTFAVILGTLLLQGLTLRPLVHWLGLPKDLSGAREELNARIVSAEKVIERITEMAEAGKCSGAVFDRIRAYYEDRLSDLRASLEMEGEVDEVGSPQHFQNIAEQRMWWQMVQIERETLLSLRRDKKIGDEAMHEIERDIDLFEARLIPSS
ncbi:Na+/H+ antiporter [Bryobacter aggregatus]|uniref:Na+/H+ antiporter n=1 Tax=Bryobacter aggregatus TaxID=360054 RepID=UPI0004E1EB55|nr:Na+/H+ antiporter [Bryobacter aggregatus]